MSPALFSIEREFNGLSCMCRLACGVKNFADDYICFDGGEIVVTVDFTAHDGGEVMERIVVRGGEFGRFLFGGFLCLAFEDDAMAHDGGNFGGATVDLHIFYSEGPVP